MNLDEILSKTDLPDQAPLVATITVPVDEHGTTLVLEKARYCTEGGFAHWHGTRYDLHYIVEHHPSILVEITK